MNKLIITTTTTLIITMLSACSQDTQTVEWYLEHKDVLEKEFKKCKDKTLAELEKDKHCAVIRKAQDQAFWDHQENAPLPNIKFE